jgi:hypothetical protein
LSGELIAPAHGFAVPLENGKSGAGRGIRLRVDRVKAGRKNLEIDCTWWQSRWDRERRSQDDILVLYLPAIPAAVLLEASRIFHIRSLNCVCSYQTLGVTMPDAELVRGVRFTAEVLDGAQLWCFAPGESSAFVAVPTTDVVQLQPPK